MLRGDTGARRQLACAATLVLATLVASPVAHAFTFGLDDVAARAEKLAKESFQDTKGTVPDWLLKITYDQWRDIRFRQDQTIWRDKSLPFQVQLTNPDLDVAAVRDAFRLVTERGYHRDQHLFDKLGAVLAEVDRTVS